MPKLHWDVGFFILFPQAWRLRCWSLRPNCSSPCIVKPWHFLCAVCPRLQCFFPRNLKGFVLVWLDFFLFNYTSKSSLMWPGTTFLILEFDLALNQALVKDDAVVRLRDCEVRLHVYFSIVRARDCSLVLRPFGITFMCLNTPHLLPFSATNSVVTFEFLTWNRVW